MFYNYRTMHSKDCCTLEARIAKSLVHQLGLATVSELVARWHRESHRRSIISRWKITLAHGVR